MSDTKHEFQPHGGEPPRFEVCAYCGNAEDHASHKNEDGTSYLDTNSVFDRMRFDGTLSPGVGE